MKKPELAPLFDNYRFVRWVHCLLCDKRAPEFAPVSWLLYVFCRCRGANVLPLYLAMKTPKAWKAKTNKMKEEAINRKKPMPSERAKQRKKPKVRERAI